MRGKVQRVARALQTRLRNFGYWTKVYQISTRRRGGGHRRC